MIVFKSNGGGFGVVTKRLMENENNRDILIVPSKFGKTVCFVQCLYFLVFCIVMACCLFVFRLFTSDVLDVILAIITCFSANMENWILYMEHSYKSSNNVFCFLAYLMVMCHVLSVHYGT